MQALEIKPAVAQLMEVIAGQNEQSPNGYNWRDCFCVDCDGSECLEGELEEFAEMLDGLGWSADSVARATAICPACANREFQPTEEQEREDFKVYEARGK